MKEEPLESHFEWLNAPTGATKSNLFIQELVIPPIFINLTFQKLSGLAKKKNDGILNVLSSALGIIVANVDDAPLKLKGIELKNIFDSKSSIVNKLINKYKHESTKMLLRMVGSVDIIGNPVKLFSNISTGVRDLIEKPVNGFVHGPLEGGKGLVAGAGSLMKNTISGTFNSVGKMTGSLASGISTLTMDEEFISEREHAKRKRPKHIVEGLQQGVTSLITGVGAGLAGLIEKPIQGASKGGFFGFVKGTIQGVTGLVVKPVAGILDATSKTAEGIKNTATMNDQKPNEMRSRYPRAFYNKEKNYRAFNETDADIMYYLQSYRSGLYANISLLYSFDIFPNEKEKELVYIFVISLEYFLYWNIKEKKIIWDIDTSNIEKIKDYQDGFDIILRKPTQRLQVILLFL